MERDKGTLRDAVYEELAYYRNNGFIHGYHPSYQNEGVVIVDIGF